MAVDPLLDILLDLDRLEKDRQAAERALEGLPAQIKGLEDSLSERRRHREAMVAAVEAQEQRLYAASHQVIAANAAINRLQESIAGITQHRAYEALQAELLSQQEVLALALQRQAALRAELEPLRAGLARAVEDETREAEVDQESLLRMREALLAGEASCAGLDERRETLLKHLPSSLAMEWRELAQAHKGHVSMGRAKGLLSVLSPEESACKICYTELDRRTLRALRQEPTVLSCPNCGAFLLSQNPSEKRLA